MNNKHFCHLKVTCGLFPSAVFLMIFGFDIGCSFLVQILDIMMHYKYIHGFKRIAAPEFKDIYKFMNDGVCCAEAVEFLDW